MKPLKSLMLARDESAFSQMDLLALLVGVTILVLVLFPAAARNRIKPEGTQCINNLRQLSLAWVMYATENNGKIMPNVASVPLGYGSGNPTNEMWVVGYLSFAANNPDNTNSYYLAHSFMGPYVNQQTSIFKCPSDFWQCQEAGQLMDRVRSYSMNYCMEGGANDAAKSQQNIPIDQVLWDSAVPRYGYHKLTDPGGRLPGPAPASAWVLCDEHPNTINNGALAWGQSFQWADLPASYHELGDNFGFADGHVEYHQWFSGYSPANNSGICKPVDPSGPWTSPTTGFNSADINWVTLHGTATYP